MTSEILPPSDVVKEYLDNVSTAEDIRLPFWNIYRSMTGDSANVEKFNTIFYDFNRIYGNTEDPSDETNNGIYGPQDDTFDQGNIDDFKDLDWQNTFLEYCEGLFGSFANIESLQNYLEYQYLFDSNNGLSDIIGTFKSQTDLVTDISSQLDIITNLYNTKKADPIVYVDGIDNIVYNNTYDHADPNSNYSISISKDGKNLRLGVNFEELINRSGDLVFNQYEFTTVDQYLTMERKIDTFINNHVILNPLDKHISNKGDLFKSKNGVTSVEIDGSWVDIDNKKDIILHGTQVLSEADEKYGEDIILIISKDSSDKPRLLLAQKFDENSSKATLIQYTISQENNAILKYYQDQDQDQGDVKFWLEDNDGNTIPPGLFEKGDFLYEHGDLTEPDKQSLQDAITSLNKSIGNLTATDNISIYVNKLIKTLTDDDGNLNSLDDLNSGWMIDEIGSDGTSVSNVIQNANTSTQFFNDNLNSDLRKSFLTFTEYYKSAGNMVRTLNSILKQSAKNISG